MSLSSASVHLLNTFRDGDASTSLESSKEIFPNTQSKPLLAQLEPISPCPIACYLGEETDTHLATTRHITRDHPFPEGFIF